MPRKTVSEKILEDLEDEDTVGDYLTLYDFEGHIKVEFYDNLHRLFAHGDGELIQKSVVRCSKLRTAMAVKALVKHYGGKALLFEVLDLL